MSTQQYLCKNPRRIAALRAARKSCRCETRRRDEFEWLVVGLNVDLEPTTLDSRQYVDYLQLSPRRLVTKTTLITFFALV